MDGTENIVDFLQVPYDSMGFLVNRSQFSNSMYIQQERKVCSRLKYLDSILSLNNERVIAFNLDYYLKDLFNFNQENTIQLALLSRVDTFSKKSRLLFKRLIESASVKLSDCTIGIKVASQAKITRLNLEQIMLPPVHLKMKLRKQGLLGIRFAAEKRAEYFLDLETLIFSTIINTYRKHT